MRGTWSRCGRARAGRRLAEPERLGELHAALFRERFRIARNCPYFTDERMGGPTLRRMAPYMLWRISHRGGRWTIVQALAPTLVTADMLRRWGEVAAAEIRCYALRRSAPSEQTLLRVLAYRYPRRDLQRRIPNADTYPIRRQASANKRPPTQESRAAGQAVDPIDSRIARAPRYLVMRA